MIQKPDLVEQLFSSAFDKPRDPRSPEYKAGVRAVLTYRVKGGRVCCPYGTGTSQFDAFYSGTDEGHRIWRAHLETEAEHAQARGLGSGDVC